MPAEIPLKERLKIQRHSMPAQDPEKRVYNFNEVNLGYSPQTAREEALRCLQCKDAPCMQGCPVHVHIPDFLSRIVDEDYIGAADTILKDNRLPAICGRVCPQEDMCESQCVVGKKGLPVAIGNLERFSADITSRQRAQRTIEKMPALTGKKIAIIGSGPSSLACAGDLVRYGHSVTIYEALHAFGGVLVYGIPEFRLPKDVVRNEVDALEKLGVHFEKNIVIGMTLTLNRINDRNGF